jgi:hypothetical protein
MTPLRKGDSMKTMQSAALYQPTEDIYDVISDLLGSAHTVRLFDTLNNPEFD